MESVIKNDGANLEMQSLVSKLFDESTRIAWRIDAMKHPVKRCGRGSCVLIQLDRLKFLAPERDVARLSDELEQVAGAGVESGSCL